MTRTYLIRIRNIILLILVQSLIFNRIHLFGYATAAVYLIFLLKLPRYTSRNELLLWAFIMGITIDLFGSTPGINAAAATLLA
ncbi:MAG: rod shape-determining protein MreD, partial [Bacteroidaceae bacterium]|nr:rod shape-determining protein MreD [Bacteroidaceae bacterium]